MPWTSTKTAEGKDRLLKSPRFQVTTITKRFWTAISWAKESSTGKRIKVDRSYRDQVSQFDLTRLGNSVFWRGGRITPRFSTKKSRDVEDVRKNV